MIITHFAAQYGPKAEGQEEGETFYQANMREWEKNKQIKESIREATEKKLREIETTKKKENGGVVIKTKPKVVGNQTEIEKLEGELVQLVEVPGDALGLPGDRGNKSQVIR